MNKYEVDVPGHGIENIKYTYYVEANSYEEAIQLAKESKYSDVYFKSYGTNNYEEHWDEARVSTL